MTRVFRFITFHHIVRSLAALSAALLLTLSAPAVFGQPLLKDLPADLAAATIIEHRGDPIPLDLLFTDSTGKQVLLGDYFDGKKPVVLVLGYFTCPMVCPVVFNNSQAVFNELAWKIGKDYQALTVSFDQRDTPERAAEKKATMIAGLHNATGPDAWPFLTSDDPQTIRRLGDSVGFIYKYIPRTEDFSHPTAIIILTPDGKVSNYLYGVKYKAQQVRLALLDASDGKIGDVFDRILLRCYHYDPNAGGYVLAARKVMTIAGLITMTLLGGVIGFLIFLDRRRTRRLARAQTIQGKTPTHEVSHS